LSICVDTFLGRGYFYSKGSQCILYIEYNTFETTHCTYNNSKKILICVDSRGGSILIIKKVIYIMQTMSSNLQRCVACADWCGYKNKKTNRLYLQVEYDDSERAYCTY